MKYAFIAEHVGVWPINLCGKVLIVSRSGFYKWQRATESARALENVLEVGRRMAVRGRIHQQLKGFGYHVGKTRVERIMRSHGLRAKTVKRYRKTTDSSHALAKAPNLLSRKFMTSAPNRAWVSDVTHLWTREGWLYLSVTLDLFSRRVIGWSMSERLDAELVVRALEMALGRRTPSSEMIHSDQGKEYASVDFRQLLEQNGIVASMSRKGNCWDNAVAESFFHTLKSELTDGRPFSTKQEARSAVFEWIEVFYNRQRLHSSIGYRPPAVYEAESISVA